MFTVGIHLRCHNNTHNSMILKLSTAYQRHNLLLTLYVSMVNKDFTCMSCFINNITSTHATSLIVVKFYCKELIHCR